MTSCSSRAPTSRVRVDGWDWVYPGEFLCESGAIAKGTATRAADARLGFQDFGTARRDFGVWIAF